MTLIPFVMGSASKIECFDESSPCLLEQTSMCVIDTTVKDDPSSTFPGQSKYVPWLVCMDSNGDKTSECYQEAGVDADKVSSCLKSDSDLVEQYLKLAKGIRGTPTVKIDGKEVDTSYSAIHTAICKADPSLKGCSSEMPSNADREVEVTLVRRRDVVV